MPAAVFLMSDIEGSTRLWASHPDTMADALARHDALLREVVTHHGGHVFKHTGDGMVASFDAASDALAAAVRIQERLAGSDWGAIGALRARIGIHAGDAQLRDGDWFGPALNRTARLMSVGHGGQVLASATLVGLAAEQVPADVALTDLGMHRLRDLAEPEHVFEVSTGGMVASFPPLRTIDAFAGNLPRQLSSFLGRDQDLGVVVGELQQAPVVTLTGPGGVGKTRLALQVAGELVTRFPAGAWLCELAPVNAPGAVDHAVADALGIRPGPNETPRAAVLHALADQAMLLVVDNCEHVLDAAADLVGAIVRSAPRVRVLATSREPLGIVGEQVVPVAPLPSDTDAVALFAERARSVRPGFEVTDDNAAAVTGICRRLDGIPLAIELAAARARSLTLGDLADRLSERFRLLSRRTSAGPGRHETLQAAVAWSYDLLDDDQRRLFDRLSVFAGGFDLEAAVAVSADEDADELDLLDALTALVDKSLVQVFVHDDHTRYGLLETMRQFGAERLVASGEAPAVAARHGRHFAAVAGTARRMYEGTENRRGADLFDREWDNLRAAHEWALANADGEVATAVVGAPYWYAYFTLRRELGDWALAALAVPGVGPPVYGTAALAAHEQLGDSARALDLADTGLELAVRPTDPQTATCWFSRAAAIGEGLGDAPALVDQQEQLLTASAGSPFAEIFVLSATAAVLATVGAGPGLDGIVRARRLQASLRNPTMEAVLAWAEASILRSSHRDLAGTAARYRHAMDLATACGSARIFGLAITALALSTSSADRDEVYGSVMSRLQADRNWSDLTIALEGLAADWATSEQLEPAALLLGHLEARDRRHVALAKRRARALDAIRRHPAGDDLLRRGGSMSFDEIVAVATAALRPPPA